MCATLGGTPGDRPNRSLQPAAALPQGERELGRAVERERALKVFDGRHLGAVDAEQHVLTLQAGVVGGRAAADVHDANAAGLADALRELGLERLVARGDAEEAAAD